MINNKVRDYLAEEHEEAGIFNGPTYDDSILGLTLDGRVVYDYDLMIKELMTQDNMSMTEAIEFIEYNTLRILPYVEESIRPVIMMYGKNIKEIKNDSNKT